MGNVPELIDEFMKIFEKRIGKDDPGDIAMGLGMMLYFLVNWMVDKEGKTTINKKEDDVLELVSLLIRGKHPVLMKMKKKNDS